MQTNKECFRCRYFDRYYTKGVKRYNRTKFGWCSVRVEIVSNHDNCQEYVIKSRSYKNRTLIKYCLNDILTEISELRKLLEEETNELNQDL